MIVVVTGSRAVIAAVIVALGLAGCSSEDPEPKVAPSKPSSPSTSTVAEPEAPELPEAARGTDAAAAEAFVEFFFDTLNYAQSTGNVSELEALARLCSGCDGGADSIVATYERGGHINGGTGDVTQVRVGFIDREPRAWASVECTVVTTKQVIDLPGKSGDETYPPGKTDVRLLLEPAAGSWVVRSLVTR